jgi:hypothetical protein
MCWDVLACCGSLEQKHIGRTQSFLHCLAQRGAQTLSSFAKWGSELQKLIAVCGDEALKCLLIQVVQPNLKQALITRRVPLQVSNIRRNESVTKVLTICGTTLVCDS